MSFKKYAILGILGWKKYTGSVYGIHSENYKTVEEEDDC